MYTKIKLVLNWYLYAFTYALIFIALFSTFPEQAFFTFCSTFFHNEEIGEMRWDNIYMSTILILSLLLNGFVIYMAAVIKEFKKARQER